MIKFPGPASQLGSTAIISQSGVIVWVFGAICPELRSGLLKDA